MPNQIQLMLSTLQKSVVDIVTAAPENRDELLKTTFTEFNAAFEPELEKAAGSVAEEALTKFAGEAGIEEPLYKGLGCVGRIANLMSMVASSVKRIEDGKDYSGDENSDPANDEVMSLLDHMVAAGELALRAAVNDHVDLADDGDMDEDGMNYVTVPNAEAPDDAGAALVLKTVLPLDLAKFAADPAAISMAAIELGTSLLLEAGVQQEALSKLFDVRRSPSIDAPGGALAKNAMAGTDPNADPNADPGTDPNATSDDGSSDPNDLVAQVEIMGRIAAAQLMQVDHIMQLMGATASDGSGDAGTDPNADAAAGAVDDQGAADGTASAPADGSGDHGAAEGSGDAGTDPKPAPAGAVDDSGSAAPPKKAKPFGKSADADEAEQLRKQIAELTETMEKRAAEPSPEVVELRKMLGTMQADMKKLAAQPAPAKAVLGAGTMSKAADTGGADPRDVVLEQLAKEYDAARSDNDRNLVLAKAAIKLPGVNLSGLRKAA